MGLGYKNALCHFPFIYTVLVCCQDETGSKLDSRGDSAVSKGTTDSGVVMENREIPVLPGAVPTKRPPLTCVRECEVDRITQKGEISPRHAELADCVTP